MSSTQEVRVTISSYDTFLPYEFYNRYDALEHIEGRCCVKGAKFEKALIKVRQDEGHLVLRCPIVGDYITVAADKQDILWIDYQLKIRNLYKLT